MGDRKKMEQLSDEIANLVLERGQELDMNMGDIIHSLAASTVAMTAAAAKNGREAEALISLLAGITGDAATAAGVTFSGKAAAEQPA